MKDVNDKTAWREAILRALERAEKAVEELTAADHSAAMGYETWATELELAETTLELALAELKPGAVKYGGVDKMVASRSQK